MNAMKKTGLFLGAGLAFATTATVTADVVIGNFNAAVGTGTAFGMNSFTEHKAFGFTMGPDSYFLDAAVLTVNFPTAGANPIVSIWSGATSPQVELIVLENPDDLLGQADYHFTPAEPFLLEAGQTYWVRLAPEEVGAGPAYTWQGTSPSTMPSGDHASAVGFIFNNAPSSFLNRLEVQGTLADVTPCPGDLTGDGSVGVADLLELLAAWGPNPGHPADLTGDGNVGVADLLELLAAWGPCP